MDKTKVFEAAGKFAAKGQFEKAAKEYQRILEEDPKDVRALQKLAEIFQKANKTKEATDLMLRVAEGYTEQGFFLKAVAVYKQVLKVGPERIEVNQRLAQLYQQLGLIGDATQQWQLVANHYDRQGNMKESLAAVRKMVELDPDNVASQVKLGELYARENMAKEAVAELRKAAAYLRRNNRVDDYNRVLERIGQLAPDDVASAKDLAKHYLGLNDTKRALAKLQVCFRADPKDVDTLQLLAQAFATLGQDAKTISVYRELASIYGQRRDFDAEKAALDKIIAMAPDDDEALGRLQELTGGRPSASVPTPPPARERTAAPQGARNAAPPPAARAAAPPPAARAVLITPEPPSAPAFTPRAPAGRPLDPNLPAAIVKILTETDVYLKYGLLPKAAEHIRKALIDDPSCIPAHEKLLAIVDRQGRQDEVLHELERLVELSREAGDVERDRSFTQELAQRDPEHPLVAAAAAAAELPPADDAELVIDPDSNWAPESANDLIDMSPSIPGISPRVNMLDADPLSDDDDDDVVMDPEPLSIAPPSIRRGAPLTAPASQAMGGRTGSTLSFHLPPGAVTELSGVPHDSRFVDAPDDGAADLAMQAAFENSLPPVEPVADEDEPALLDDEGADLGQTDEAAQEQSFDEERPFDDAQSFDDGQTDPLPPDSTEESTASSIDEPLPSEEVVYAEEEDHSDFAAPSENAHEDEHITANHETEDDLGEEFAEAEFLLSQGLTDDARHALEEIVARSPGHAGATALLEQLDAEAGPPLEPSSVPPGPVSHIDLTQELSDELASQELGDPVQTPIADPHSVSGMLSAFKTALTNTVSAEDSQTHYDLGIAYREMGLVEEAIHEFEVASQSRGRKHVLDCLMMLGMCHLERNRPHEALDFFGQALQAPGLTLEASKEAHFQLGVCYDGLEERRDAMEHYARVYKADPDYRDVKARLGRLSRLAKAGRAAAAPAGAAGVGQPVLDVPQDEPPRASRGKIGYI